MNGANRIERRVHHTAATNHVNHENPIRAGVQLLASQYRRCTLNVQNNEAATDIDGEIARARAATYEPIAAITKYISAINIALRAKLSPDAAIQSRK
jgi:hypothetical protein